MSRLFNMYVFTTVIPFIILLVKNEFVTAEPVAGGSSAAQGEFPFQVSFQKISRNNRHFCSGSIIHQKFVLTAAHCVTRCNFKDVRIIAGLTDLRTFAQAMNKYKIADVVKHPEYHLPLPKENDIALVQVDRSFEFSDVIKTVYLATPMFQIPGGTEVYVSGWGLQHPTDMSPTDKLKKLKVNVMNPQSCSKKYLNILTITNSVFCTRHNNLVMNAGVCNGDSGGPVTINKNTLVGVIKGSFQGSTLHPIRRECGNKNYPDMHGDVSKYRDWIDKTIALKSV